LTYTRYSCIAVVQVSREAVQRTGGSLGRTRSQVVANDLSREDSSRELLRLRAIGPRWRVDATGAALASELPCKRTSGSPIGIARTMKYSTPYAIERHGLTDKRDYSVVETPPGMPGDGPYLARCSHTIDILHRSCKIWLIRFGMAT
jgi:hypothetical protein